MRLRKKFIQFEVSQRHRIDSFTDFEWEDIQEKVHEGADIYDAEPKYDVWRCPECLRVYVFKGVSLLYQYKLEK